MLLLLFYSAAPRDFVPPLVPKKALRVSSVPTGRAATPPAVSGGVAGETAEPIAEAAPAAKTGGGVSQLGMGQGPAPAPPSASVADPAGQGNAHGVPPTGEVIHLDDEAEEEPTASAAMVEMAAAAEEGKSAPAAVMGTAEVGTLAPAAVTEMPAAIRVGTPAPAAAM